MFNNICLSKCPHIIVLIIKLMQIRGAILMTYVTKRSRLAKYGVNLQEWNEVACSQATTAKLFRT